MKKNREKRFKVTFYMGFDNKTQLNLMIEDSKYIDVLSGKKTLMEVITPSQYQRLSSALSSNGYKTII